MRMLGRVRHEPEAAHLQAKRGPVRARWTVSVQRGDVCLLSYDDKQVVRATPDE